jgi:outer membrane protein TolC
MLGVALNFKILSSGQRIAQVGQARLKYLKEQTRKEMLSENLLIQYETMLAYFISARNVFDMQKETRDLSLRVYFMSIKKFSEGVGSSLDMNQAQTQYFTAESNYYNALMTLVATRANLESLFAK